MKKKFTLLILLAFGMPNQDLQAQQGTVASGGELTGSGGSASYSSGLVTYTTISSSEGIASGGIQQAYEIYVLDNKDFESIRLSIIAHPNPTASTLYLNFESQLETHNTRFELYDLTGKLLKEEKISATQTAIDMQHLPSTMYFLKVYAGHENIKNFKIIKRDL